MFSKSFAEYFSKSSGFVINQLSGGGCDHMGNFPTFPVKGKLSMSPDNILNYRVNLSEEKGHAGYYETMVQEDIKAKYEDGILRLSVPKKEAKAVENKKYIAIEG